MASANRLWGAERIRGELLKLGIRVTKRTVQKYTARRAARSRNLNAYAERFVGSIKSECLRHSAPRRRGSEAIMAA